MEKNKTVESEPDIGHHEKDLPATAGSEDGRRDQETRKAGSLQKLQKLRK